MLMPEPIIFKCPNGHELTPDHFHSYVDLKEPDLMKAVTFSCDGGKRGHKFTLAKAVKSGMFTPDQAEKIAQGAIHTKKINS